MAEANSPHKTDEEMQCLECIAKSSCADILKQVIYHKVGRSDCLSFCQEISSNECAQSFAPNQRKLLCSGNISDFDTALCMKVVRQINGINPEGERWRTKVDDNNHTLYGSLKRIALFLKEVIHCPGEEKLGFHELFHLISTAFQDIQREMDFERDFQEDLNDIRNRILKSRVYDRLSSQVEQDAIVEKDDEPRGKNVSQMDYSFLDYCPSKEPETIQANIDLIEEYKHRFPPELHVRHYDVMVVYNSEIDRNAAEEFRQSIDGHILRLENGEEVEAKAMLYDMEGFGNSEFIALDAAYSKSTYAFLYLTKSFVENDYDTLVAESLLMDTIKDKEKKWRVVPIHTSPFDKRQYKVPLGINTLKGFNAWKSDEFYWQCMDKLLAGRILERKNREIKMFERQYKEALRIQREGKKQEDLTLMTDQYKELNLNLALQKKQDRPCVTVQPMEKPMEQTSAAPYDLSQGEIVQPIRPMEPTRTSARHYLSQESDIT